MDKELIRELILKEFIEDNTMEFITGDKCYCFDEILQYSITQYTPECFKGIIIVKDWGNIRVFNYTINENQFIEKSEITISQEDIKNTAEKLKRTT